MPAKLLINRTERTVLKYVKLDFQGEWEYSGGEHSFRPVGQKAELLVVTEAPVGTLVTHWFTVRRRRELPNGGFYTTEFVLVPKETNIVYIPERCTRKQIGDHTQC